MHGVKGEKYESYFLFLIIINLFLLTACTPLINVTDTTTDSGSINSEFEEEKTKVIFRNTTSKPLAIASTMEDLTRVFYNDDRRLGNWSCLVGITHRPDLLDLSYEYGIEM